MMGTSSGTDTALQQMDDLLETKRMLTTLIKQYTYSLNHNNKIMAEVNAELQEVVAKRQSAIDDFNNAPRQIESLNVQLTDVEARHKLIKNSSGGKAQKIKRFKALQARLQALQAELDADGIDVDAYPEDDTDDVSSCDVSSESVYDIHSDDFVQEN